MRVGGLGWRGGWGRVLVRVQRGRVGVGGGGGGDTQLGLGYVCETLLGYCCGGRAFCVAAIIALGRAGVCSVCLVPSHCFYLFSCIVPDFSFFKCQ